MRNQQVLLFELEDALKHHNWRYQQSVSGEEWRRGSDNADCIARLAWALRAAMCDSEVDALFNKYDPSRKGN